MQVAIIWKSRVSLDKGSIVLNVNGEPHCELGFPGGCFVHREGLFSLELEDKQESPAPARLLLERTSFSIRCF